MNVKEQTLHYLNCEDKQDIQEGLKYFYEHDLVDEWFKLLEKITNDPLLYCRYVNSAKKRIFQEKIPPHYKNLTQSVETLFFCMDEKIPKEKRDKRHEWHYKKNHEQDNPFELEYRC